MIFKRDECVESRQNLDVAIWALGVLSTLVLIVS